MYNLESWNFGWRCVYFLEPVFASWSLGAHEILGVALVARARFGLGEYIGWVGFSL